MLAQREETARHVNNGPAVAALRVATVPPVVVVVRAVVNEAKIAAAKIAVATEVLIAAADLPVGTGAAMVLPKSISTS